MLKLLTPPAKKKVSCVKRAHKLNKFKQKPSFQSEKEHVQRFNYNLLQTFNSTKCNNIFATSVPEVGEGNGSIMSNKAILNFMSYNSTII